MRGARATSLGLFATLVLPGCMRTSAPVAAGRPESDLDAMAYGRYPCVPNMSVESAIAIAGGFSPRALRDRVTLTHTDDSGPSRVVVPLGTALSPGDTVLVGERWF